MLKERIAQADTYTEITKKKIHLGQPLEIV